MRLSNSISALRRSDSRPEPPNTPTRHLAVAMYADHDRRNAAFAELYARPDRAVAPNPAVDLAFVLRCMVHARRIKAVGLLGQPVMFGLAWLLPQVDPLMLFITLYVWLPIALKVHRRFSRRGHLIEPFRLDGRITRALFLLPLPIVTVLAVARILGLLTSLAADGAPGRDELWPIVLQLIGCFAPELMYALVMALMSMVSGLSRVFAVEAIPSGRHPRWTSKRRIAKLVSAADSRVFVHDREAGYALGCGEPLDSEPAVRLELEDPRAVDVRSLFQGVEEDVRAYARDAGAGGGIAGVGFHQHVYLAEGERKVKRLENGCKVDGREYRSFAQAIADPGLANRCRVRVEASSGDGTLTTSTFLRIERVGSTLYCEVESYFLPRTRPDYEIFEGRDLRRWQALAAAAWALSTAPILLWVGPAHLLGNIGRWIRCGARRRIWRGVRGARIGLRQLCSESPGEFPNRWREQRGEAGRIAAAVEHWILSSLKEQLRGKADISAFDKHGHRADQYNFYGANIGAVGPGAASAAGAIGPGSRGAVRPAAEDGP